MTRIKTMMFDYISKSPSIVRTYLRSELDEPSLQLVDALKSDRSIIVTGCGTSYHLAIAAARYFRDVAKVNAHAIPSFDLAWYASDFVKDKILFAISHSGATKTTLDIVKQVKGEATQVFSLSKDQETKLAAASDVALVLPGGFEKAFPKTMTFTSGCIQLYRIALEVAKAKFGKADSLCADEIADLMETALHNNLEVVQEAVQAWKNYEIFNFVGGGPAWLSAMEVAIKMKENNYTASEGIEVEEITHGRTAAIQEGRPVVLIALNGPSVDRLCDVLESSKYVGAPTMVVQEEGVTLTSTADFTIRLPKCPNEIIAAIVAMLPLQVFSNDFALANGYNPDAIRLDDPKWEYPHGKWIFPPGTH